MVAAQFKELRNITVGWLDGEGDALDKEGLYWLGTALRQRITFNDLTLPHLYPTEEGCVQAEWTIGAVSADLEINLSSRQAIWGWSDLSTNDSGERALDLNEEADWRWLSKTLTRMAMASEK